ncbi:hypothetical protein C1H76_5449 [Elsinoe australis]|uniref:Uncharacterized protein n=1 Tax=Elsinoe australis TaxID=40998 RepID=A0A4U7AZE5_9PEZI|nr:hypothetical protein C1H76_5449 [Elsinoe australis]
MSQYPTTSYCYIAPQSAQMFYWYTPRPSNFCSNETMIATANISMTGPSTVDYSGTILTSPTVYISYHNLTYAYSSGLFSTRLITETIIPYHPDEISMVCGYRNIEGTMAINYADLVSPVPWSSYGCQPRCFARFDTRCQPVDEVLYPFNPVLDVPPRMSKVLSDLGNPHPEECKFAPSGVGAGGWFDPPHVLRPAEHLLEPKPTTAQSLTLVDPITREPPSPAPTLAAPPQKTADPLGGDDDPPARPPSPGSTVPGPGPSLSFSTAKPIGTPPAVGQIGPDTPPSGHDPQVGAGQGNDPPGNPSPGTPSPVNDPNEVPSQDNGLPGLPSPGNDPTKSLAQVSSPSTGGIDSKPDTKLAVSGPVLVIGRSTITAGAAPVTVVGHIIFIPQPQTTQFAGSLSVAKPVVVIDSTTMPLGDLEQVMATAMPELRVAGVHVITQGLPSGTLSSARLVPAMVIAGTKTLLPGDSPITIGGRVVSVAPLLNGDGSADGFVIVDGTTVAMKSFEAYVKTAIPNLRDPGIVATTVVVSSSRPSGTNAVVQDIAGWIMSGLAGQPPYNGIATQSGHKGGQGQNKTVEGFKGRASRLGKIKIEMWCLMVLFLGLVNLVI